ncbi:Mrr restriction system protein [Corynebacterium humireducens NBRC 106098 = DSM 45392]|uniref:Mrr restriction system protein n=1 Tax=Corynebacterium humireducens NBRC 106098 = DSM 45392 TaxID=1223515 RepID=A0A0B5D4I0_9CORY|nr:restriction endonuclease [Corynebacterium humireducens]AJE33875.1 Mrr restriction system protein [Corynebacterium humireducens NBRC 106098 = DSM 45392]
MSFSDRGMPTHQELVLPVLQAVKNLGGTARSREVVDEVISLLPNSDALIEISYPNRPNMSVLRDRTEWGRSTAKLVGGLEQPNRGMYMLTDFGEELLALPESEAITLVKATYKERIRERRMENYQKPGSPSEPQNDVENEHEEPSAEVIAETQADKEEYSNWEEQLLNRLHQMSPEAFEKFVLYLLRRYGLKLTHIGGTADEGIDGIGTAPLSPVLSSRVAVQIKRYAPNGKPITREVVALFQRDAQTKGAERAILVTLSRFTEPARKAATLTTPTVDLIDGERLAQLIKDDGESGVRLEPTVNEKWFDQFE